MSKPYKLNKYDVASFEIIGYRQPDGKIKLGHNESTQVLLDDFPSEVEFLGVVYTLEEKKQNSHSPNNIEWGIYV